MKKMLQFIPLNSTLKYLSSLLFVPLLFSNQLYAQGTYKLNGSKENVVKVSGKSNVHDWAMTAQNPTCEAEFGALNAVENIPKSLTSLSFSVNAKSLKSEHSSMDTRTYKVIKADEFPKITFKQTNAVITAVSKGKFSVKTTGSLTIAGVSKTITLQVNGTVNADQSITCTGTQKLKLTDYSIQPPSFMLGAMKVGDELSIAFNLNFKN
ncbi:MAG: YceI family protein [Pedobacter sp.]|nr:MAG: YceI family protein [Pedobacter sp.]